MYSRYVVLTALDLRRCLDYFHALLCYVKGSSGGFNNERLKGQGLRISECIVNELR